MGRTLHSEEHRRPVRVLAEARKKSGLTQQELAVRLGRVQSYVAKYEGGERRVDVVEFIEIARALDLAPARLFKKVLKE